MAARSADCASSVRMTWAQPERTPSSASRRMRSMARRRPASPSRHGPGAVDRADRGRPCSARIASNCALDSTGLSSISMSHCAGSSSRMLPRLPRRVLQRHHPRLAQAVDRRVGDLAEVLAEIVVQAAILFATARRSACRRPSSRRPPCASSTMGWRITSEILQRVAHRRAGGGAVPRSPKLARSSPSAFTISSMRVVRAVQWPKGLRAASVSLSSASS